MGCKRFSKRLVKWLHERDYVRGDWPHNVAASLKKQADREVGRGYKLDACGFKTAQRTER